MRRGRRWRRFLLIFYFKKRKKKGTSVYQRFIGRGEIGEGKTEKKKKKKRRKMRQWEIDSVKMMEREMRPLRLSDCDVENTSHEQIAANKRAATLSSWTGGRWNSSNSWKRELQYPHVEYYNTTLWWRGDEGLSFFLCADGHCGNGTSRAFALNSTLGRHNPVGEREEGKARITRRRQRQKK